MKIPKIMQGFPAIIAAILLFGSVFGLVFQFGFWGEYENPLYKHSVTANIASICALLYIGLCLLKVPAKEEKQSDLLLISKGVAYSQAASQSIISALIAENVDGKIRFGMRHYIDSQDPPSPLSTAYAIWAILACPKFNREAPLLQMLAYIVENRSTSGWRSTSQAAASPEVTADILRVIRAIDGRSETYLTTLPDLVSQVQTDPNVYEYTYIACAILIAIASERELSLQIDSLRAAIMNGFHQENESMGYWYEVLKARSGKPKPSVASTARCLMALSSNEDMRNRERVRDLVQKALNWIYTQATYPNETQHITRRNTEGGAEVIVPRDFTSALVVVAACEWHELKNSQQIAALAFEQMMSHHSDGLWRWSDGRSPVWMNAQAIDAVNSFTSAASKWKKLDEYS